MKIILIYTTNPNLKEAKRIGKYLLEKKLIKCANYFPIESAYEWKGKIENVKEVVAIFKTAKKNWKKIKEEVEKIHSYKIPCILKIEVETNEKFGKWVGEAE